MQDSTGKTTLGVDISAAGTTSADVQKFVAGLPSDQATKMKAGCKAAVADPANQNASVLAFCKADAGM